MKTNHKFTKIIDEFIDNLPERPKEIIQKRFGLFDGCRMTLDSIGKQHGLTRERIRQIEKGAKLGLLKQDLSRLEFLVQKLRNDIDSLGRVCREDKLVDKSLSSLAGGYKNLPKEEKEKAKLKNYVVFLLSLFPYFSYVFEKPENYSVWYSDEQSLKKMISIHNFFKQELLNVDRPLNYDEYKELVKKAVKKFSSISEEELLSYLDISKEFRFNPFSEFGLSKWPLINLSNINDKAYLILKKKGKPMHFAEITNEINKIGFDRTAKTTTVHNQLIQDPRFVLYSRGTYALKEWGYHHGSLKDIIVRYLKNGAKTREKLVEEVQSQRDVKEATILLNLKDNLFRQLPDGRWCLRK